MIKLKELLKEFNKAHFLNLIQKEIDSLKGQIAYAKDKVNYKGTADWEKKEFKAVLKDKVKDLAKTIKHYKRVQKLKEGKLTEKRRPPKDEYFVKQVTTVSKAINDMLRIFPKTSFGKDKKYLKMLKIIDKELVNNTKKILGYNESVKGEKVNEDSVSPSYRRMLNALSNVIPMVFPDSKPGMDSPIFKFQQMVMQNKPEAQQEWPKVKKYIDKMFNDIKLKKIKEEQKLLAVLDKTAKGMKV